MLRIERPNSHNEAIQFFLWNQKFTCSGISADFFRWKLVFPLQTLCHFKINDKLTIFVYDVFNFMAENEPEVIYSIETHR